MKRPELQIHMILILLVAAMYIFDQISRVEAILMLILLQLTSKKI
ncbi:Uncharacterised protein [Candidatus Ornithobacterium hominis]|nr:Uncharacterised protein [Candidatus Ornithobacterium hominis]